MKNNLTYLLFAEIDNLLKREKKGRKKMSKLTDAIDTLKADVADLKKRLVVHDQANADELAAAQAEADKAAASLSELSADVQGIDSAMIATTPVTTETPAP